MNDPWIQQLVAEVFARGPGVDMEEVGKVLRRTPKDCERALRSPAGQRELERYQTMVRASLAARRVRPMELLAEAADAAVAGLIRSLALAEEKENPREMRESAVAILGLLGHVATKRIEKRLIHSLDSIDDPVLLARIIRDGEVPMIEGR